MSGRHAEASTASADNSPSVKIRNLPSRTRVAPMSSFIGDPAPQQIEIDRRRQRLAQRIEIERIELIGRQRARDEAEPRPDRRSAERSAGQERRRGAHPPPEPLETRLRLRAPAVDEARGEQDGVDRAGAGAADRVEGHFRLFEQPVENAPGEGAEGAAALKAERQALGRPDTSHIVAKTDIRRARSRSGAWRSTPPGWKAAAPLCTATWLSRDGARLRRSSAAQLRHPAR